MRQPNGQINHCLAMTNDDTYKSVRLNREGLFAAAKTPWFPPSRERSPNFERANSRHQASRPDERHCNVHITLRRLKTVTT
jgi:hypothetical protein